MQAITGVFRSRTDAENAAQRLREIGIHKDRIVTLTPQLTAQELSRVKTNEGEQPGMVTAMSAVVGGAVGAGVIEALAVGLIPGVGPVLAIGMAGGAAIGALTGGAIGKSLESRFLGALPQEELFFYEDAARQGRTVVIGMAGDGREAEVIRGTLEENGAETINEARKKWWLGVRDVEKEHYDSPKDFDRDEPFFREGFEAALHPSLRGKTYEQSSDELAARHSDYRQEAFRRGYKRGGAYRQALFEQRRSAPW